MHALRFAYLKAFLLDRDLSSIQVASFYQELLDLDVWCKYSVVCFEAFRHRPDRGKLRTRSRRSSKSCLCMNFETATKKRRLARSFCKSRYLIEALPRIFNFGVCYRESLLDHVPANYMQNNAAVPTLKLRTMPRCASTKFMRAWSTRATCCIYEGTAMGILRRSIMQAKVPRRPALAPGHQPPHGPAAKQKGERSWRFWKERLPLPFQKLRLRLRMQRRRRRGRKRTDTN